MRRRARPCSERPGTSDRRAHPPRACPNRRTVLPGGPGWSSLAWYRGTRPGRRPGRPGVHADSRSARFQGRPLLLGLAPGTSMTVCHRRAENRPIAGSEAGRPSCRRREQRPCALGGSPDTIRACLPRMSLRSDRTLRPTRLPITGSRRLRETPVRTGPRGAVCSAWRRSTEPSRPTRASGNR